MAARVVSDVVAWLESERVDPSVSLPWWVRGEGTLDEVAARGVDAVLRFVRQAQSEFKRVTREDVEIKMREAHALALQDTRALVTTDRYAESVDGAGNTPLMVAAWVGSVPVAELLLRHGACIAARNDSGETALHRATQSGHLEMMQLLMEKGAEVEAVSAANETPLIEAARAVHTRGVMALLASGANINYTVWRESEETLTALDVLLLRTDKPLGALYACTFLLCSHGAKYAAQALRGDGDAGQEPSANHSQEEPWIEGLRACISHWQRCFAQQTPLTDINMAAVSGGAHLVHAFLGLVARGTNDRRIVRSNLCMIGQTESGKTSLVNSFVYRTPWLVGIRDRTVGIKRTSVTIVEESEAGEFTSYDITCWDLAGHSIYHNSHAMLATDNTLYVVCVDLEAYSEHLSSTPQDSSADDRMQRFLMENAGRWLHLLLLRKPRADFMLVGSKCDLIDSTRLLELGQHLEIHMHRLAMKLLQQVRLPADREAVVIKQLSACVTVSVSTDAGVASARESLERALTASSTLGQSLPPKCYEALNYIRKRRVASSGENERNPAMSDLTLRVNRAVVSQTGLSGELLQAIEGITPVECSSIYQILHRLGDIVWFRGMDDSLEKWIIADPQLVCDAVGDILNHNYEARAGEMYDALRRDGKLKHALLVTFPVWTALEEASDEHVYLFKHLLQILDVAFPAGSTSLRSDSDLIVSAYWKRRSRPRRPLNRQASVRLFGRVRTPVVACLQYQLPPGISETVFDSLVVRCHRPLIHFVATSTSIETFRKGDLGATVTFNKNTGVTDTIRIEVSAGTCERAWEELQFFCIRVEMILEDYAGLRDVTRQIIEERHDGTECEYNLKHLDDPAAVTATDDLRRRIPWVPDDLRTWLAEKPWKHPEQLHRVQTRMLLAQMNHTLSVLQKLVVAGSDTRRRLPALWTLTLTSDRKRLQLRFLSDLSGACFHDAVDLEVSRLGKYASYIQVGTSLLSLVPSAFISSDVVEAAVDLVVEAVTGARDYLARAETVYNVIEGLQLTAVETVTASSSPLSPEDTNALLAQLLSVNDPNFDVCRIAKLRWAATRHAVQVNNRELPAGMYVLAHEDEIAAMEHYLIPCDPPTLSTPVPRPVPTTETTSYVVTIGEIRGLAFPKEFFIGSCRLVVKCTIRSSEGWKQTEPVRWSGGPEWTSDLAFTVRASDPAAGLQRAEVTLVVDRTSRRKWSNEWSEVGRVQVALRGHVATGQKAGVPMEIHLKDMPLQGVKETNGPRAALSCRVSIDAPP